MMANFLSLDGELPAEADVPAWLLAADNHNLGNTKGGSWLDADTWVEKFENVGRFIATATLSGGSGFYNTGVTVGNFFGANAELINNDQWITSIDSDLGAYYAENRQAVDLAGFIGSSLVPGIGAVKILNVGQKALRAATEAGSVGVNMSRATKLLAPATEDYVKLAAADFAKTNASFSLINANVAKALGSGVWQNTLEAAAFETAAYATMFKSPILEEQDGWDIVKNIAIGGVVGGTIGGAFSAAKIRYGIKANVQAEDIASKYATAREAFADKLTPAQKMILMAADRDGSAIPTIPSDGEPALFIKDRSNFVAKMERTNNAIRTETHNMTIGKDVELGNAVADAIHVNPNVLLSGKQELTHVDYLNNFLHAENIARLREVTKVDKDFNKAVRDGDIFEQGRLFTRFVKLTGDEVGHVSPDMPLVNSLADSVIPAAGQTTKQAVLERVKEFKFSKNNLWDISKLKGLSANYEAEAREIWLSEYAHTIKPDMLVHVNDVPMLEHLFKTKQYLAVKFIDDAKVTTEIRSDSDMYELIKHTKHRLSLDMLHRMVANQGLPIRGGTDLIARTLNMSKKYLEGDRKLDREFNDLFYRDGLTKELAVTRKLSGLTGSEDLAAADVRFRPEYVKISYRVPPDSSLAAMDGNVIDGMTYIRTKEKEYLQVVDRVFAAHASKVAGIMPVITDDMLWTTTRYGSGPGMASFASGSYGSVESAFELMGQATSRLKTAFKEAAKTELNSPLVKIAQDQKSAIELMELSRQVARTSEHYQYVDDMAEYGLDEVGPGLIARKLIGEDKDGNIVLKTAQEAGLQDGAPTHLPIKNATTADAVKAHVNVNDRRLSAEKDMRAAQGRENYKHMGTFQPIRPDPRDFPFFAFVKDPDVTGAGHTSMIHANSEKELNALMDRVKTEFPQYKVITKSQAEEHYRAHKEYEFDRTLHENYIDSDLKRRGIASEFFVKTDPQVIANDVLNHHLRQEDILATELVRMKYQKQFDFLEDQAKMYSGLESSRYGSSLERVEKMGKNPFISYIKTGLDINRLAEHPLWYSFNRTLDNAVSVVFGRVRELTAQAKSPEELEQINSYLKEVGFNNGYYDAATNLLANHPAPRGELTKFVRTANAILSRFTLGLDPINALNNGIGANILRGVELSQVSRGIAEANPALVGKLSQLTKIQLSPESKALVTSPAKIIAKSFGRFFKDAMDPAHPLMNGYRRDGFVRNLTEQFYSMLDDVTLQGTETATDLQTRLQRAFKKMRDLGDAGEKYTGNTFAEEFNRFISADVMRQITDIGIEAGSLSAREAKAYINTFVNRVEGNIIASQRPLMFQGPIGQAIGLFQTYQFNLMQNLFRYVGEGKGKDVAMLLGLQGTFYGMNGLPGFAFMNQHIVGTASGNKQHRDVYDATYGIAGQSAGELLLYGIPSFVTRGNLYSRGDINPRQVTIVPTSPEQVPIVGAYTKFVNSILGVAANVKDGAPVWDSFLAGIEHNGLSRPLAGMAQFARGFTNESGKVFSTSTRGTMMYQNDLLSWATAIRVAGAKPLDEAIVNDGVYRLRAYEAVDRSRKFALSEAVKIGAVNGEIPSEEQVAVFAERYAALGGKQSYFNRWMMEQIKHATTPQSQEIARQLKHPLAYKVQMLMGGEPK